MCFIWKQIFWGEKNKSEAQEWKDARFLKAQVKIQVDSSLWIVLLVMLPWTWTVFEEETKGYECHTHQA